jgi:cleavage stimulation factor subunit 3
MAEYDPARQGAAWEANEEYGETGGDDQERTQHSADEEYSVDMARNVAGDGSSHDGPADDVGDYDPASVTSAPDPTLQTAPGYVPLKPSPQPAAKKPRTAGGFLVGDSDSEDDDAPAPGSSGHAPGPVSQSSYSQSPAIAAAESTGAPSNAFPDSQVKAAVAMVVPTNSLGNGDIASPTTPQGTVAAAPAPPDRMAFLEARVRDDPRGALDQWMALIAEHRERNNLEDLRQIYDRFLVLFPQAVSPREHRRILKP